jgi:DNA repair protein RecO (recombination protein O)
MRAPTTGLYRDQGIVLKGIRLGEADRILSIYTQSNGRIRAVAKGVRKSKSRFGGRLDAFTHVDLLLYKGRGDLDIVTQAEIIGRYPALRTSYSVFCAAAAMADAVERTTPDRERNVRLFILLRTGLQALEDGAADPSLLAYAFLAKVASIAGLHPAIGVCVGCGAAERVAFSFGSGGAVCGRCVERIDPKASVAALDAWANYMEADWPTLRTVTVPEAVKRETAGLLLGFVQWQMDYRLRAYGVLAGA